MSRRKDGLGILGAGAAACVACCAGPILALLGGLGVAGLVSTLVIGVAGVVIAAAAVVAIVVVRRRRTACDVSDPASVPVAAPSLARSTGPPTASRAAALDQSALRIDPQPPGAP